MPTTELQYGIHPGLRFASLLDGRGACRDLGWDDVRAWRPEAGVLWVHLERDDETARRWLREESGIDQVVVDALLAEEARPRVEDYDDALLIVLRGVNRQDRENPEDLVPVRLWIDRSRVVSLRDKDHYLMALREIREALIKGRGPVGPGELFARIADRIMHHVEPVVGDLEDDVDALSHNFDDLEIAVVRDRLADYRRHAIQLRRYLAPQREALYRLQLEDATWLTKRDKVRIREVTDRTLRFLEDLDAIRDRTMILHEDLTALVSERIAGTTNRLTAITAMALPPTLLAGVYGMNLEGIPWAREPWSFAVVCAVILVMFPLEILLLKRLKWL
jgi:zinc transporter